MDRRMDGDIDPGGLGNFVPQGTPAARELEELFSTVIEKSLEPIHNLRVYCKN
jgi:hypothetical protein